MKVAIEWAHVPGRMGKGAESANDVIITYRVTSLSFRKVSSLCGGAFA